MGGGGLVGGGGLGVNTNGVWLWSKRHEGDIRPLQPLLRSVDGGGEDDVRGWLLLLLTKSSKRGG